MPKTSESQSHNLALEIAGLIQNLLAQGKGILNVFTGVKSNGQQFVCLLSPLNLDRLDKLDFMIEVLRLEDCRLFAHSMQFVDEANIETLTIFAGGRGGYCYLEFQTTNNDLKLLSERQADAPETFFQELLKPDGSGSPNSAQLLDLWRQVRPEALWRNRPQS